MYYARLRLTKPNIVKTRRNDLEQAVTHWFPGRGGNP